MSLNERRQRQILASFKAWLALAQFRFERILSGGVLLLYVLMLVAILAHGYHIGTWANGGGGEHVYLYTIGVVLLVGMIYQRFRHIR